MDGLNQTTDGTATAPDRWGALHRLLEIPSVSADPQHAADVADAVDWVGDLVEQAGGEIERTSWENRALGIMRVGASTHAPGAPTVMLYGHVDVQPAGDEGLWTMPPFVPSERDGWLYARGAADDKGPFYVMLEAALGLAKSGELPVNVLVLCDAEEEVGGRTLTAYLDEMRPTADGCLVLDATALGPCRPALTIATRGVASFRLRVFTNPRDLHSGTFGGAALNAGNLVAEALAAVSRAAHDPNGELWDGVEPPSEAEAQGWRDLESGADVLAGQGALPAAPEAAAEFYDRTWCRPAFDVHGLEAGSVDVERNVVLAAAAALFSLRVAPGQSVLDLGARVEGLIRSTIPSQARVELTPCSRTPSAGPFAADSPFARAATAALTQAFGRPPLPVRSGGSLPILAPLRRLGIETVVSGLDVPAGNIHAPNERVLIEHLERGAQATRELLVTYAARGDSD